jgi:predicted DCC family thiol-disulfide oxidoreductase YuxK
MPKLIILFDGVCNLCNGFVQFVIKRDPHARFKFAALQSDAAVELLLTHQIDPKELSSVIFIVNKTVYTQSDAALKIAQNLGSAWPLAASLLIIPKFIRNAIYHFIAKNRYRWFGKTDQCMMPNPRFENRFF